MRFAGLFAIGLLLARATPTYAQKPEGAAAFQRAKDLLAQGKVAEACAEFELSMRLDPQNGTLYNLALCHEQLGKVASAWVEFKELADNDKNAARARDSAKRASALEKKLTRMRIVVASPVDGLIVKRDGVDVTVLVGKETPVDPATYSFVASAPGYDDATLDVDVSAPGTTVDVTIPALVRETGSQPGKAPIVTDPYASRLTLRPLILPKGVYEVGLRGVWYMSEGYAPPDYQEPIDTEISARAGFGRIEARVSAAFHTRYEQITPTRPTITRAVNVGADYSITPLFTAGVDITKHHPLGGDLGQGLDFRSDLTAKRIISPMIALVGSGGIFYESRESRGSPAATEFSLVGGGTVQLAPLERVTLGAIARLQLNASGDLHGPDVFLHFGLAGTVSLTRNLDAYIQTTLIVLPAERDDQSLSGGAAYRLP